MPRLIVLCCLAIGLSLVSAGSAKTQDILDHLADLQSAFEAEDIEATDAAGSALIAAPEFATMPEAFKAQAYYMVAAARLDLGEPEDAITLLNEAETVLDDTLFVHMLRAAAYIEMEDWPAAHADITRLHTLNTDAFGQFDPYFIGEILDGLRDAGQTDLEVDLIERLIADYTPWDDPFASGDNYRLRLIRILVQRGDQDAAMARLTEITSPWTLATIRYDGSFRPLWGLEGFDRQTDVLAAARQDLLSAEETRDAHPNQLAAVLRLMGAHETLGNVDTALDLARRTQTRIEAGEAFTDAEWKTNWFLNDWAYLEIYAGNLARGRELLDSGAELDESGMPNVSQVINRSVLSLSTGEYDDAETRMSRMDGREASDYGNGFVSMVGVCVAAHRGDSDGVETHLAELAADWTANSHAYQRALYCAGRDDDAAALMIDRLHDPDERAVALGQLQSRLALMTAPEFAPLRRYEAWVQALAERPDVAAAVAEAGRIEHWNIYRR